MLRQHDEDRDHEKARRRKLAGDEQRSENPRTASQRAAAQRLCRAYSRQDEYRIAASAEADSEGGEQQNTPEGRRQPKDLDARTHRVESRCEDDRAYERQRDDQRSQGEQGTFDEVL